jgi:hypothetical protein
LLDHLATHLSRVRRVHLADVERRRSQTRLPVLATARLASAPYSDVGDASHLDNHTFWMRTSLAQVTMPVVRPHVGVDCRSLWAAQQRLHVCRHCPHHASVVVDELRSYHNRITDHAPPSTQNNTAQHWRATSHSRRSTGGRGPRVRQHSQQEVTTMFGSRTPTTAPTSRVANRVRGGHTVRTALLYRASQTTTTTNSITLHHHRHDHHHYRNELRHAQRQQRAKQ